MQKRTIYVAGAALLAGVGSFFVAQQQQADAKAPEFAARAAVSKPAAGASEQALFNRAQGRGNRAVADGVSSKLRGAHRLSAVSKVDENDKRTWLEASDWRLRVSDDGNNLRFRRDRMANVKALALSQKPTQAQAAAAALAVVKSTLSDVVKVGQGEELVLLGVRAEYEGGASTDGKTRAPETINGWTVGFGRAVRGKLVVGGGSHAAITFDPSGNVEAFDVDWPEYTSLGTSVATVGLDVVRERGRAKEAKLKVNEARSEEGIECGYFDPGGRRRSSRVDYLQPGCVRRLVSHATDLAPGNSEKWATVQAIPLAKSPLLDNGWTEGASSCDVPEGCEPTE